MFTISKTLTKKTTEIVVNTNFIIISVSIAIGTAISYLSIRLEPANLVLVIGAIIIAIVVLASPALGLCLLAMSIPYSGQLQLIPNAFTASKLLAIILTASFFIHLVINKQREVFVSSEALRYYLLLPFWGLMTLPFAMEPRLGMEGLDTLLFVSGLTYLAAVIPESVRQFRMLCLASTLSAACLGIYIMVWGIDGLTRDYSFRLAAGTNENVLAHSLAVCLIFSFFLIAKSRKSLIILLLISDLFILYAIILTGSRGTWVALVACLFVPLIVIRGISLMKRVVIFIAILTIILSCVYIISNNLFGLANVRIVERLYDINTGENASGGRLEFIWPYYLNSIAESPLIGNGLGFRAAQFKASHNNFLFVTAHYGIIGLFIYIGMWFKLMKESCAIEGQANRMILISAIIFLIISGMTHDTISLKSYALAIGMICFFVSKYPALEQEA